MTGKFLEYDKRTWECLPDEYLPDGYHWTELSGGEYRLIAPDGRDIIKGPVWKDVEEGNYQLVDVPSGDINMFGVRKIRYPDKGVWAYEVYNCNYPDDYPLAITTRTSYAHELETEFNITYPIMKNGVDSLTYALSMMIRLSMYDEDL